MIRLQHAVRLRLGALPHFASGAPPPTRPPPRGDPGADSLTTPSGNELEADWQYKAPQAADCRSGLSQRPFHVSTLSCALLTTLGGDGGFMRPVSVFRCFDNLLWYRNRCWNTTYRPHIVPVQHTLHNHTLDQRVTCSAEGSSAHSGGPRSPCSRSRRSTQHPARRCCGGSRQRGVRRSRSRCTAGDPATCTRCCNFSSR